MTDASDGSYARCTCGHLVSHHYSESETAHFNGFLNPGLAGKVIEYTWMRCEGDLDPQGEPCSAMQHSWSYPESMTHTGNLYRV
jgi:hypothetical protein